MIDSFRAHVKSVSELYLIRRTKRHIYYTKILIRKINKIKYSKGHTSRKKTNIILHISNKRKDDRIILKNREKELTKKLISIINWRRLWKFDWPLITVISNKPIEFRMTNRGKSSPSGEENTTHANLNFTPPMNISPSLQTSPFTFSSPCVTPPSIPNSHPTYNLLYQIKNYKLCSYNSSTPICGWIGSYNNEDLPHPSRQILPLNLIIVDLSRPWTGKKDFKKSKRPKKKESSKANDWR